MTDSAARGEGMSELAIRYGYGAGELDFVTFKLYNDGTIKCFGRIGEIKRGKTDCPILGFWREEICASENWEHAERRLKEHKP